MDRQDHNFPYFILLHNVQSTLALRTLRYYGHPANADKSQPPPPTPLLPAKRVKKRLKQTPAITDSRY